jgi:hypothetical protein
MIKALEIYESKYPDGKLLEIRFVLCNSLDGMHYDCSSNSIGKAETGRTFRTTEGLLRNSFPNNYLPFWNEESGDERNV